MDRARLADLLSAGGAVARLCGDALAAGATFEVWDDDVESAEHWYRLCGRRTGTVARVGQPSIGNARGRR
ncbi:MULTISPECIES: hypothetical protein [unclassified Pseudofrankia]|uniref:hypothetical protein n=1 Tax=unclassified Pseudofrankia TaxID=2994372 RepID=UPI0008D91BAF|nr:MULTISPECIES: hypothetical protein [unclassified Pseudofrankia]MDT3439094.1 hypothetical protein [Pseudofrankia sp. BMG5.37]OHV45770.1 hypothetical protein BCD48_21625 [Pseudofrankia sp. BMG5.36]